MGFPSLDGDFDLRNIDYVYNQRRRSIMSISRLVRPAMGLTLGTSIIRGLLLPRGFHIIVDYPGNDSIVEEDLARRKS